MYITGFFVNNPSESTGTGDFTFSALPQTAWDRSLDALLSSNDTFEYGIQHTTLAEFEEGVGTSSGRG